MDNTERQQIREYYHFGDFYLDPSERSLSRGGEQIPLKPKQFDLLFFFVENAGRTTRKDELLDAVWPGTYVEENTLARNVSWLRTILEDGSNGKRMIETVPKLGYRFTPNVTISKPNGTMLLVEEQTVQYFRGEETLTIDDRIFANQKLAKPNSALPAFLFPARAIGLVATTLVVVVLAGIAVSFYWSNIQGDRASARTGADKNAKVEKIEIDAARSTLESKIKVQKGDFITFSVEGNFQYRQEQTWTFEGDNNSSPSSDYFFERAAPWSLVAWVGTETDQSKYFQVSKIKSITADRNGNLYFAVNKPRDDYTRNSGTLVADVAIKRHTPNERPQIKIGSVINLQNRHPNTGGYLDAWGNVWSKREFKQITTETMFVSTHYDPNRDSGSGSWEIVSADGKDEDQPLVVGDRVHLRNKYPDAGYLDSCGWVKDLQIFKDFKDDQTTAIFTTKSPNRDYGTGTWIIRSSTETDGSPVLEGDSIALENGFLVVLNGVVYKVGFLSVAGDVKDIPAYNDYDGASLVFSQDRPSDQPLLDIWTITLSKAVLAEK